MASSTRQTAANRANGRRSAGPKTDAGKARSSLNARKHGLTAKSIIIGDEDPADFERLRAELEEQFAPQTSMEYELVERLACLNWRLRRVARIEADAIEALRIQVAKPDPAEEAFRKKLIDEYRILEMQLDPPQSLDCKKTREQLVEEEKALLRQRIEQYLSGENLGLAFIRDSEQHGVLSKISRYEATLMNLITRTLALLNGLQAARTAAEQHALTIDHHSVETREPHHKELTSHVNDRPTST